MKGEDHAVCHLHLNFEHLMKAFRDCVKKHCKCGSNHGERWETHENEDNICTCTDCRMCPVKQGVLSLPYSSFIKHLCCESDRNYPNYKCLQGMCGSSECGVCVFDDIIINRKCIKHFEDQDYTKFSMNKMRMYL